MYLKSTDLYYGTYPVYYYDSDSNMWIWSISTTYYQSAIIGYPIKIDGATQIYSSGYIYNGYPYYVTTISSVIYYVWYSTDLAKWIISTYLGYGIREYSSNSGDPWWSLSGTTITGTYVKRGNQRSSGSNKVVTAGIIEGRSASALIGIYEPVAGSAVTGNVWIGWKILEDTILDPAIEFIQDEALYNSLETYTSATRSIWFDGSNYIISNAIGTKDTLIGYWSCATLLGEYTRTFTGEGDAPVPETYTIILKEYRALSSVHDSFDIYMGQVAVWL